MLSEIQKTLEVPKNQYNAFGKYKYRSCEDILTAVKPLLPKDHSLVIKDEMVFIGDRYYVCATATILDGSNKEVVSSTAYAREPLAKKGMDEAQVTGATSSYARKYALNGLFAIDDTKDADHNNKHDETKHEEKKEYATPCAVISEPQRKRLYAITKKSGWPDNEVSDLLKGFGFESSKEITRDKYEEICNTIENAPLEAEDEVMI